MTVYKKLNPEPFLQACMALIHAAGLELDQQKGSIVNSQTANKS